MLILEHVTFVIKKKNRAIRTGSSILEMSKFRLYAWGANSHGQLGLGYQSEESTLPREVDLSSIDLDPRDIKKICGGAGHTLILDKKGRVYSCGWNSKGQTGNRDDGEGVILHWRKIDSLEGERVEDVACGWNSSVALLESGRVSVWGSNCYGQLGNEERSGILGRFAESDKTIRLGEGIKGVSMGLRHSALVTEGGRVLVTGSGSKFQLGIPDIKNKAIRSLSAFTEGLRDVVEVACGQNHTVVLRKDGQVYSWGDNKHGQLGVDNGVVKKIVSPEKINTNEIEEPISLRVGWTHTSVLNADGRVFAWGRNTYGQLGYLEEKENECWIPKRVNCRPKIRQLAVGSEHNVALTEDGTVLSWGWNEHGNCGNGSTKNVLVPETVNVCRGRKGILVGSGAGHSFAIFADDT